LITPETYAGKSEHSQQVALFMWANHARLYGFRIANDMENYGGIDVKKLEMFGITELKWLHAIPNGGLRSKATAGKLKAEGVKEGVVDVFWPYVTWFGDSINHNGLYIEMKAPGKLENTSKEQEKFIAYVQSQGYYAVVCDNWRNAANAVQSYYESKL
jgi:hypothetical protein